MSDLVLGMGRRVKIQYVIVVMSPKSKSNMGGTCTQASQRGNLMDTE